MGDCINPLCPEIFYWANYRSTQGSIKLHTVLDYDGLLPVFLLLTDGKIAEINAALFQKGSVEVIGRGYLDIKWLHNLDISECLYVYSEEIQ